MNPLFQRSDASVSFALKAPEGRDHDIFETVREPRP
jgi:hypothetical protein